MPGTVRRLAQNNGLRVPHMGWNSLSVDRDDALVEGIGAAPYAYFVHSYAVPCGDATVASSDHGGEFSAIVRRGNVCGMQFHPERSASVGARLLQNFLAL
jgi:glutamine amidotransferase